MNPNQQNTKQLNFPLSLSRRYEYERWARLEGSSLEQFFSGELAATIHKATNLAINIQFSKES